MPMSQKEGYFELVQFFRRLYVLCVGFKMKPVEVVLRQKPTQILP